MRRLHPAAVLVSILFFVFVGRTLRAQQETAPPAAPSPESVPASVVRVQTRLVVIDVIAQDKKGNPITDLGRPDFRLLEDGVEQKISIFSFQQPATTPDATAAAAATHEAPLPPNHFRNKPHFKANSALNVILLDALNTTVLNQAYARDEMIKFLRTLPPGQPVAIYGLGRKLRLLQDFTTDIEALEQVIASFKGERSHLHSNAGGTTLAPLTLSGWAEQILVEKAPQFKAQMEGFAQEDASSQMDFRVQYTVTALSSLARMLAGYPGRKNLIWITEAVPITVFGTYGSNEQHENDSVQRAGSRPTGTDVSGSSTARAFRNYEDAMARVANLFADAQVAVYPIDARGLVGSPMYNVANNVSGQAAMGGLAIHSEGRQSEELFQAHTNMLDIAEKTGGRAFYNRNNLNGALRSDIEDGSTYYTLAYYPSNKNWDGRFRKVQVAALRGGVKLRYRIGYYAVDQAIYNKKHPELRDLDFANALDPNAPVSTALQFEAWVTPPSAESENKVLVRYAIDPRRLALDVGADGLHHGEVDCAVRVFSPKDVEHPVLTDATRMEAAVKPAVFERINRSWFPCQVKLDLKPGFYLLRLAVRDNVSGLLGSLNASVTVPQAAEQNVERK